MFVVVVVDTGKFVVVHPHSILSLPYKVVVFVPNDNTRNLSQ